MNKRFSFHNQMNYELNFLLVVFEKPNYSQFPKTTHPVYNNTIQQIIIIIIININQLKQTKEQNPNSKKFALKNHNVHSCKYIKSSNIGASFTRISVHTRILFYSNKTKFE